MPQVYAAPPRNQYIKRVARVCVVCGRHHNVNGVKIELDHIDGNIHNNEFNNFQWLCQEHHMIKHGRIAWNALNTEGVQRNQSAEEIQRILAKNNPHSREALENCDTKYIRKAVAKLMGWHRDTPRAATTEVVKHERHGFVTVEIRGTRIEIPCGETVRIL